MSLSLKELLVCMYILLNDYFKLHCIKYASVWCFKYIQQYSNRQREQALEIVNTYCTYYYEYPTL
jgi:hypothetical protein